MSMYQISVTEKKPGLYEATCAVFSIPGVTASSPDVAVKTLKSCIEREGCRMLQLGESLPDEPSFSEGTYVVDCDIMQAFKNSSTELVRRTISLPKWMDILIRNSEIDSSGVFRDAVMKKLEPSTDDILSLADLKSRVDESILKAYVREVLTNSLN